MLEVPFGLLVWSTGICASPLVKRTTCISKDETNSFFQTDNQLRVLDNDQTPLDDVFALGDCAQIEGKPLPATAQVASQKGKHLAFVLNGHMDDENGEKIFKHKDMGSMASLGSGSAIVDSPKAKAQGRVRIVVTPITPLADDIPAPLSLACMGHLAISIHFHEHVMA